MNSSAFVSIPFSSGKVLRAKKERRKLEKIAGFNPLLIGEGLARDRLQTRL